MQLFDALEDFDAIFDCYCYCQDVYLANYSRSAANFYDSLLDCFSHFFLDFYCYYHCYYFCYIHQSFGDDFRHF